MRRSLAALGLVSAGFLWGVIAANNNIEPEVEYKTKTVHEPEPYKVTETVEVLSEPCDTALQSASKIYHGAVAIDASSTKQLDIISSVRVAIAGQDMAELNRLDAQQRNLQSRTLGGAQALAEAYPTYLTAKQECTNNQ